jgi:predicted  nucleic acid-binding Zn-ribbon protein
MSASRRGFVYPLEAVAEKCCWELEEAAAALAELQRTLAQHNAHAEQLRGRTSAARAEWERQAATPRLNLALREVTCRFLAQLDEQLGQAQARMRALENESEAVRGRLQSLRKLSDHLAEHRQDAVRAHDRQLQALAAKEADDMWLQRMKRRERA